MSTVHHTVTQRPSGWNPSHLVECAMTQLSFQHSRSRHGGGLPGTREAEEGGAEVQDHLQEVKASLGRVRACLKTTKTKALQCELKQLRTALNSQLFVSVLCPPLQVCAATQCCYGFTVFVSCQIKGTILGIFINSEATQNNSEDCIGVLGLAQNSKSQQVVSFFARSLLRIWILRF